MIDYKDIARNFGILDRRSRAYVTVACEQWHIGYSEYVILEILYEQDGCSQEELASRIFTDKAIVARAIKLLENKNLITRRQDKNDKRLKRVFLTSYAHSLEHDLSDIVRRWIDTLSAGVDPDTVENVYHSLHIAAEQAAAVDIRGIEKTKGREQHEK